MRARAPSLPVLLISGEPYPDGCEADAILQKPFNAEALWTHAAPLLDRVLPPSVADTLES